MQIAASRYVPTIYVYMFVFLSNNILYECYSLFLSNNYTLVQINSIRFHSIFLVYSKQVFYYRVAKI